MGAKQSSPSIASSNPSQYLIRVPQDFPYFVLCFRKPLTPTLILHDQEILQNLERCVRKRWSRGVKKINTTNRDGSAEIQLADDQFKTLADLLELIGLKPELVFNFKRFFCEVFGEFREMDWRVALCTDTWTRYPALSTVIFERRRTGGSQFTSGLTTGQSGGDHYSGQAGDQSDGQVGSGNGQLTGQSSHDQADLKSTSTGHSETRSISGPSGGHLVISGHSDGRLIIGAVSAEPSECPGHSVQETNEHSSGQSQLTAAELLLSSGVTNGHHPHHAKRGVFALSLSFEGNVLLVNASESIKTIFRDLVTSGYSPGVLEAVNYGPDARYRLAGSPWTAWPGDLSVRLARRMILDCFDRFYRHGARFYCRMNTADFGDTLFFEEPYTRIVSPFGSTTNKQARFACLTLYNENKMHAIAPSDRVDRFLEIVIESIKTYWHLGLKSVAAIQDEDRGSYEITLNGSPFVSVPDTSTSIDASSANTRSAIDDSGSWQSRYFVCHLFQSLLARAAFRIVADFDAHRKNYDTATYILRELPRTTIRRHSILAFDRLNLIRVVNDDDANELSTIVARTIESAWSKGRSKLDRRFADVRGCEFSLAGQPWFTCLDGLYANSLDGIAAQTFVCLLFGELRKNGWRVLASVSTCCLTLNRGRHKQRTTADTWILVKEDEEGVDED